MPDPKKRIIVDGVDFAQILFFPRIIAQAASALQPARLIVGLFMVVALVTFGRIWDGLAEPQIHPRGLAVGLDESFNLEPLQLELKNAVRRYSSGTVSVEDDLGVNEALAIIEPGYRKLRSEAADEDRAKVIDREYRDLVTYIENNRPKGAFEALVQHVSISMGAIISGVLDLRPSLSLSGFNDLLIVTPQALWAQAKWFTVCFGLLFVVIFAIGGGALSRMAAAQVATGERITIRHAVDFSVSKWSALVWAQILPLILALVLCGVTILMGVFMLVPVIDIFAAVAYGLALLVGFVIAFLALGYVVGFPMLVPAVACENCDGADAVQRAYAYAVTRPLQLLGYWIVAILGLALGFVLVALVASLTLNITAELFKTVSDNPALTIAGGYGDGNSFDLSHKRISDTGRWHSNWAADAIQFWQSLVVSLVAAWVLAYHFGSSTIMYLLMRRRCDGQEIDDIWQPGESMAMEITAVAAMVDEP